MLQDLKDKFIPQRHDSDLEFNSKYWQQVLNKINWLNRDYREQNLPSLLSTGVFPYELYGLVLPKSESNGLVEKIRNKYISDSLSLSVTRVIKDVSHKRSINNNLGVKLSFEESSDGFTYLICWYSQSTSLQELSADTLARINYKGQTFLQWIGFLHDFKAINLEEAAIILNAWSNNSIKTGVVDVKAHRIIDMATNASQNTRIMSVPGIDSSSYNEFPVHDLPEDPNVESNANNLDNLNSGKNDDYFLKEQNESDFQNRRTVYPKLGIPSYQRRKNLVSPLSKNPEIVEGLKDILPGEEIPLDQIDFYVYHMGKLKPENVVIRITGNYLKNAKADIRNLIRDLWPNNPRLVQLVDFDDTSQGLMINGDEVIEVVNTRKDNLRDFETNLVLGLISFFVGNDDKFLYQIF